MSVFFIKLKVRPTELNTQVEIIEGAFAHCWLVEDSPTAAYNKASFLMRRDEWEIVGSTVPVEVFEEDFVEADLGREQLAKARLQSMAIVYVGWSRDGNTTWGPSSVLRSGQFDLNTYVQTQKKLAADGKCLHFDNDRECGDSIEAHSIQKNGLLREIAENGHVYVPTRNIGIIRRNQGRLVLEKRGISKVSTFVGFCAMHDSALFQPIDTRPLVPTDEQIALYAYRCLCRELFIKENSSALIKQQLATTGHDRGTRMLLESLDGGTSIGLGNLRRHKEQFDQSMRERSYTDGEFSVTVRKARMAGVQIGLLSGGLTLRKSLSHLWCLPERVGRPPEKV